MTSCHRPWLGASLAAALVAGFARGQGGSAFRLGSHAFPAGGEIPARHTCDGEDVSPPRGWNGAPAETKSFAVGVDDPDAPDPKAPRTVWVHWTVYDVPPDVRELHEDVRSATDLPKGAHMGRNDWGKPAWGGPCPPVGRHRYFHKLYALDVRLGDRGPLTKRELEAAMQGHVLAEAELIGTYERKR